MPIQHLLYRCPRCGHDPITATARGARCDSCGASFEQGRASVVRVRCGDGTVEETSARALMEAVEGMSAPSSPALDSEGGLAYETAVYVAHGHHHQAVWWRGSVLGFFERITDRRDGVLRIDAQGVTVDIPGGDALVWTLDRISAIQISSKAIQINIQGQGLYQMEFVADSPKRWEDLLRLALTRFYGKLGREVVEFQPRVVTRPLS